ncbi:MULTISPECIES: hypothetical protein [unclassified Pseudomonas]|uniref:hypothetical protein n=1 Tax=unclassified Pseudomonas TaxID=196821 RepID=UPI0011BF90A2|nr:MULTISPECIES: hypothetical protein [unclassified Pseudomonas]
MVRERMEPGQSVSVGVTRNGITPTSFSHGASFIRKSACQRSVPVKLVSESLGVSRSHQTVRVKHGAQLKARRAGIHSDGCTSLINTPAHHVDT